LARERRHEGRSVDGFGPALELDVAVDGHADIRCRHRLYERRSTPRLTADDDERDGRADRKRQDQVEHRSRHVADEYPHDSVTPPLRRMVARHSTGGGRRPGPEYNDGSTEEDSK
jgi:hypothetical protein